MTAGRMLVVVDRITFHKTYQRLDLMYQFTRFLHYPVQRAASSILIWGGLPLLLTLGFLHPVAAQQSQSKVIRDSERDALLNAARSAREGISGENVSPELLQSQALVISQLKMMLSGNRQAAGSSNDDLNLRESGNRTDRQSEKDPHGVSNASAGNGTRDVEASDSITLEPHHDLKDAVWGHLPSREQNDLLRAYSESYLPGYESQVRRYFDLLARLRSAAKPNLENGQGDSSQSRVLDDQGSR